MLCRLKKAYLQQKISYTQKNGFDQLQDMTSQAIWAVDTFSFSEQFRLTQNIFLMQPSVMVTELRCNNEGVWVGKGVWMVGGGWVGVGGVGLGGGLS